VRRYAGVVPVQLNHTIVGATDSQTSATFFTEVLGLAPPTRYGSFYVVTLSNDASLDFLERYGLDADGHVLPQHYAFLVSESEFDEVFGRITARGLPYWADPGRTRAGEINTNDGGRGVYWEAPDGHMLEIITRPYGS
jgi:catechol 2,3-dioxygenase-like lactoylglutathione lyase family enzyme